MQRMKRLTAIFLAVVILFSLSSCKMKEDIINTISDINAKDKNPGIDEVAYSIPYDRSDSLNPYEAKTDSNIELATLMYDALYGVDNEFKPIPIIAEKSSVTEKTLTVTIKSGLKFTDGTNITAVDILYSFRKAKNSDNYSTFLTNITDADGSGNSVTFNLKHFNNYEANNLVFPIIKAEQEAYSDDDYDEDEDEDNSSNKSDDKYDVIPTGSGRYFVADAENSDSKVLKVNKNRLGGYHPIYNLIGLTDVKELTSLYNLFNLSEIDFYTNSFSEGKYVNYTGSGKNKKTSNFVYIGVNSNTESLKDGDVRRAIAMAINRSDLASIAFTNCASATSTPFHSDCTLLKNCTLPTIKHDIKAAIALLEDAGFKDVSAKGIRSSEKSSLELSLLVNRSNGFKLSMARSIQQSLAKVDIKINLQELEYADYVEAVKNLEYDLYIGEAKLSYSFDFSRFFTEDGGLDYGINPECDSAKAYKDYLEGKNSLQQFIDAFSDELPIIPIAYRDTLTVKSSKITTEIVTIPTDTFYNVGEWNVKNG